MKFTAGYQLMEDRSFTDTVSECRASLSEVYFSWPEMASGRGRTAESGAFSPYEAQERILDDLKRLGTAVPSLNLLLNANCYGAESQARSFFRKIGDLLAFLQERAPVKSVTTCSPLIAKFIRRNFSGTECRASVNMEIGTVEGMEYLADYFDSYYLKRELNYDWNAIHVMKDWCDSHGKKLYALANSGCLNHCSAHNFHDNLVAHEHEIARMDNAYEFQSVCSRFFEKPENREECFRRMNFIRPEDTSLYDGLFESMKLATRVNRNPAAVIRAYASGRYSGNVLDLLEPDHAERFYPYIIENRNIPSGYAETRLHCGRNCGQCDNCKQAFYKGAICLPVK